MPFVLEYTCSLDSPGGLIGIPPLGSLVRPCIRTLRDDEVDDRIPYWLNQPHTRFAPVRVSFTTNPRRTRKRKAILRMRESSTGFQTTVPVHYTCTIGDTHCSQWLGEVSYSTTCSPLGKYSASRVAERDPGLTRLRLVLSLFLAASVSPGWRLSATLLLD